MDDKKQQAENAAFEYGWRWFQYHASQRMTILQFYFAAAAFLIVGYYYTVNSGKDAIALGFSIILIILTILFMRLDARTMELIKIGERLLLQWEERISKESELPVDLIHVADTKSSEFAGVFPKHVYSYRQITRLVFWLFFLGSLAAAFYAAREISIQPAPRVASDTISSPATAAPTQQHK